MKQNESVSIVVQGIPGNVSPVMNQNNNNSEFSMIQDPDSSQLPHLKKESINSDDNKSPALVSQASNTSSRKKSFILASPTFKKMFGVLGNIGNNIKKGIGYAGGNLFGGNITKVANLMGNKLLKIQENLRILRKKKDEILTEKERKVLLAKKTLKRIDTITSLLAVANSILTYYENEDFYKLILDSNDSSIIKDRNESTPWGNAIRAIVMASTGVMLFGIYMHYRLRLKILKIKKLRLEEDTIYSSGLSLSFAIEIFICSICCPPYFDFVFEGKMLSGTFTYSYNAVICVITLFKNYLLIRLFQHYSNWTNENAIRACKKAKCQANFAFAMKAELKKRPYVLIAILMMASIMYLGLAMRTFEMFIFIILIFIKIRSYTPNVKTSSFDFSYMANAMWLIIITMTTVGFGEGYPETHLGRFIGVIACIIGMLLVSLMVVSLTLSSEFTPEEAKAFQILKKIYTNDNVKDKAANIIKVLFKINDLIHNKNAENVSQIFVWLAKLKNTIRVFKNDYRVANTNNMSIDEMLLNLKDKFSTDIKDIKKDLKDVPELENKCVYFKEKQEKIQFRLDNIIKMQNLIGTYVISLSNFVDKQIKNKI